MNPTFVVIALIVVAVVCFLIGKRFPNTIVGQEVTAIEKDWSTWFHSEWEKAKAAEAAAVAEAVKVEPTIAADLKAGLADVETVVKDVVGQVESAATNGVAATIEQDIATELTSLIAKLTDTSAEDATIAEANAKAKVIVDAALAVKAQKSALLATHKAAVAAIK